MLKDVLLLVHPTTGVLGAIAALWVFVETMKVDAEGLRRIKIASVTAAALMAVTWVAGGGWDWVYSAGDMEFVDKGAWPAVGDAAMEFKEHYMAIILLLATYLPLAAFRGHLLESRGERLLVMSVSGLLALSGLGMEGAGAALAMAVKSGLFHAVGG